MAGFRLSRTHSQGDVTGKQFTYNVDAAHATLLAPGDVMRITGDSDANGTPEIDAGTAANSITGILFSVDFILSGEQLSQTGLPASTGGTVKVNVDPRALYEADVTNGVIAAADIGQNVDFVATAASTLGGLSVSNMTIDAGTNASDPLLPFSLVAILPNLTDGAIDGTRVLVRANATTVTPGATGV